MRKIRISGKQKIKIIIVFSILLMLTAFYLGRYVTFFSERNPSIPVTPVDKKGVNNQLEDSQKKFSDNYEPKILQEEIEVTSNYTILHCPDLQQSNDYSCGVWAALSVMEYYGIDELADNLAKKLKVSAETGTEMEDITLTLKKYGLESEMRQMTINELKTYIDDKIPVIVMIQAYNPEGKYVKGDSLKNAEWGHYVVVIGYGEGNIVFNDPAEYGRMYLTEKEFRTRWKGIDEYKGRKPTLLENYGIAASNKEPQYPKKHGKLKKIP